MISYLVSTGYTLLSWGQPRNKDRHTLMYTSSVSNWLHFHLFLFYAFKPQFCWSFAQPRGTGSQCFARVWIKGFIVWGKLENVPVPVCNGKWVTLTAEVLSKCLLFWTSNPNFKRESAACCTEKNLVVLCNLTFWQSQWHLWNCLWHNLQLLPFNIIKCH